MRIGDSETEGLIVVSRGDDAKGGEGVGGAVARRARRGTCVRCDRLLFRFLKHAQCVSTRSLRIGWPREAWHRVQRDQTAKKRQMGLCAGENSSFELRGNLGVGCWASADFTTPE